MSLETAINTLADAISQLATVLGTPKSGTLSDANLSDANLRGADLSHANLSNAALHQASFTPPDSGTSAFGGAIPLPTRPAVTGATAPADAPVFGAEVPAAEPQKPRGRGRPRKPVAAPAAPSPAPAPSDEAPAPLAAAPSAPAAAPAAPTYAAGGAPTTPVQELRAQASAAVLHALSLGKRNQVVAILGRYGAAKVGELRHESLPHFIEAVTELLPK